MSRTPNYNMYPHSGGRAPGFSPYAQNRSPMGPPDGPRHGYYPQHGESPMGGGGGPGMMQGQRFSPRNGSPFSPPAFYQSPYQQSPGSSPHESGGRGNGGYQRRDSRGRGGRGWGGRGGEQFSPSHQQFQGRRRFTGGSPYQRGHQGDNSSDIGQYFKPSMVEDPWKHLVAKQSPASSAT